MTSASRPSGKPSPGLNVTNFSTTAGRKSITPKRGIKVSASVIFVVVIVVIALYLEG